jgi:hypothetical protein
MYNPISIYEDAIYLLAARDDLLLAPRIKGMIPPPVSMCTVIQSISIPSSRELH